MKHKFLTLVLLSSLPCAAFAEGIGRPLTAGELDLVTAGDAFAMATAGGTGRHVHTNTDTAAHAQKISGNEPNKDAYVYVSGGTVSGYVIGGPDDVATNVVTITDTTSPYQETNSVNWRVQTGDIAIHSGFSHTVGKNASCIICGP